jgi:hypothetical protein
MQNTPFIFYYFFRKFHLFRSHLQVPTTTRLLPVPHLHPHLSNRHDVLDLILDQAGSSSSSVSHHFIDSTFSSTVIFHRLDFFVDCTICKLSFSSTILFINCTFRRLYFFIDYNFRQLYFSSTVLFVDCTFSLTIIFVNCTFRRLYFFIDYNFHRLYFLQTDLFIDCSFLLTLKFRRRYYFVDRYFCRQH